MADGFRVVTFSDGGQITEQLNVQSNIDFTVTYMGFERDTLEFIAPERRQRMVNLNRRYAGERYAGESHGNGVVKFNILSAGASADALLTRISTLIAQLETVPGQIYIEFKPEGATYPSYFEVRAPAKRQPRNSWAQRVGAGSMSMEVEWPVAPLVCGAPMDIDDQVIASRLADYTFDSSSASGFPLTGGDALTTERRLIHTIRGYTSFSHQVTVSAKPGTNPAPGFKLGAILRRTAADTYIECYVDDNGTNSRLRIDTVTGGTRVNRFTTNLASRVSPGTTVYVRGRVEETSSASRVHAEYFTSAPTPMGAPTNSGSWDQSVAAYQGHVGMSWIPQNAAATVPTFRVEHYVFRNVALPWPRNALGMQVDAKGDAPAMAGVQITSSGGSAAPVFALFGWIGGAEFFAGAGTGMSSTSDANALSGSVIRATTIALNDYATLTVPITDRMRAADPRAVTFEVWARVKIATGQSVRVVPAIVRSGGQSTVYTQEYGSRGKWITGPSSGTVYRFIRLGTFSMRRRDLPAGWAATVRLTVAEITGTAALFGVDYGVSAAPSGRALLPTARANDAAYPVFADSTSERQRGFNSDLSGVAGPDRGPSSGLGGSEILFPHGISTEMVVKLSSLVPDDPTASASSEQTEHNATVQLGPIIPRWHYLRPN